MNTTKLLLLLLSISFIGYSQKRGNKNDKEFREVFMSAAL